MSLFVLLLACTSVNNGNSTVTGNARPVGLGDPFAPADGGAGAGDDAGDGSADGGDTTGDDTGSSADTGGGGGSEDGSFSGSLTVSLVLDGSAFPCEGGTASFEVSGGDVTGTGSCTLEGTALTYVFEGSSSGGSVSGTAEMQYTGFEECGYTDGSSMEGTLASGSEIYFAGTYDMVDCGGYAFTFEGTVTLD